jgi:HEPN domain-containing protein
LVRAGSHVAGEYLEDLCFDAQQCAEKAIKAVFVSRGETFPYIHNLRRLLTLLDHNGVKIPRYVGEAHDLSRYAAVTRYPDSVGPVSRRDHRRAVRIATAVLGWAERQVAGGKPKRKR